MVSEKNWQLVAETYKGLQIRKDSNKKLKSYVPNHMIEGVSVVYAKCCMPVYGDPILAHTDTDRGIVIHHARCKQVRSNRADASRYLQTIWGDKGNNLIYNALIKATGEDKPGALADLASVRKLDINILMSYQRSR